MKLLAKLAWRNVWRNKRRTIITVLAVMFAALFSVAMRGVQLGTYEENISFTLRVFSGFIQIQKAGYQDNPSLQKSFELNDSLKQLIATTPHVVGAAPRVYADGLVSFKTNSLGVALFGIVPDQEKSVTTLTEKVHAGRFFVSDSSDEVVLGFTLLQNLNAAVGDDIVLLAQGYDGTLGNKKFRIAGTVKTGAGDFDRIAVFMGLRTAQQLLALDERIHVIAISLDDIYQINDAAEFLNATLGGEEISALTWETVMPELKQSIELDNISGIIFLGILIVVVAFGILNTVLMSVTERFREFGILLSVGMPSTKLVVLVFIETIIITAIGVLLGNILAAGVNYYLVVNPIQFTGEYAAMMEEYGFLPMIRSSLKLSSFINTTLSIMIIALISTIYPLYRTYHLEPLKGIRYT